MNTTAAISRAGERRSNLESLVTGVAEITATENADV